MFHLERNASRLEPYGLSSSGTHNLTKNVLSNSSSFLFYKFEAATVSVLLLRDYSVRLINVTSIFSISSLICLGLRDYRSGLNHIFI